MDDHQAQKVLRIDLIGNLRNNIRRRFDFVLARQKYLCRREQSCDLLVGLVISINVFDGLGVQAPCPLGSKG